MFKQLLEFFTKQFIKRAGRKPQTPAEVMSIQNDVVRYINETKGKGVTGSVRTSTGDVKPIPDPFQGFTPKVIQGGKSKEGIGTLFKDSPEAIAKIKAENKAAAERLKAKKKIDLSKYTDEDLNALVAEDKKILAEANELSGAGINYGRVQEIEARRKEIKKILEAAQAVPESGYGNIKADLALQKQKKTIKPDPEDLASGGMARAGYAEGTSSPRFNHPDKRQGILGSGVTWTELMEGLHPFMQSSRTIEGLKKDIIDPIFKKKLKWNELDDYYRQLEMDKDMRDPEDIPSKGEQYAATGGIARVGMLGGGLIKLAQLKKMFPRIHVDSLLEASRIKDPNKLKQLLNSFRKTEQSIDKAPSSELFNFDPTGRAPNATGGMARVALGGGGKAVNWFIKNFKELLKEADNPGPWSRFSKMGSKDKQTAVADAEEMLKRLEAREWGDDVPDYLLDDIIADKRFSKLKGSKATDPDLAEVENLAEGYSKLKNAREKKFRGAVEDFRTGDSINHSFALDNRELFTPTTTDMYGKTWKGKKDWIKKEIAQAKKTQKTIGPPPSSRHPEYRSMVQIRKGLEDRITALEMTEELGGNIKMFDRLRMMNYPSFKQTLDKRDWLMPPGGLKRREAFVIDIGRDTLPPKPLSKVKVSSDEYVESLDKKIMDEMDLTKSEMDNMSSTALDDLRRNADPMGMQKHFDEITEGRGVGDFAEDSSFLRDEKQTEILDKFDTTGKKGHASGGIAGQLHLNEGGRVPMIFGGSAGLKGLIASIKAGLNKGRPEKIKTLFPKYSADEKKLLKLGEKYLPKDSATLAAKEIEAKAEGIQVLIDRLKHDKKLLAEQAKNKAKNDPSLNFLMESLETTMPEAYGPHLKKYTNIDKDILQLETIKKNLIMKDRKLHASGGIAGQLHMNRPGYGSGLKVLPKVEITQTESTPAEGIDVGVRDTSYGGSGLYQGDKAYVGGDYMTGNVKVDVQKEGETLFKDTMSKDDMKKLYIGLGQKEGNRVEVGTDTQGNYTFNIVKSFNQGGRAGTGLNYLLGEDDQNVRTPYQGGIPGLLGE